MLEPVDEVEDVMRLVWELVWEGGGDRVGSCCVGVGKGGVFLVLRAGGREVVGDRGEVGWSLLEDGWCLRGRPCVCVCVNECQQQHYVLHSRPSCYLRCGGNLFFGGKCTCGGGCSSLG